MFDRIKISVALAVLLCTASSVPLNADIDGGEWVIYSFVSGEFGPEYHSQEYRVRISEINDEVFTLDVSVVATGIVISHEDYYAPQPPHITSVYRSFQCGGTYLFVTTYTSPPLYADTKVLLPKTYVFDIDASALHTEYFGSYFDVYPAWNGQDVGYDVGADYYSECRPEIGLVIEPTQSLSD